MKRVKPVVTQLFCAAVLLLFPPWLLLAEQLPIKIYTTSNGLVSNKISRIVRDSRGYLWFCTEQGLSRFDGYRFTNYTMDEGLPDNEVNDLLETRNGDYWVATGKGLCRFYPSGGAFPANLRDTDARQSKANANAMFVVYHPGEGRRASAIKTIYEDKSGTLWCGTWQGLYQVELTDQQVNFRFVNIGIPIDQAESYVVRSLLEDKKGALWIATANGLYRLFRDGRVEHFTKKHGLVSDKLMGIIEDREGKLWVGDRSGGLCQLVSEPDVNRQIVARYYTSKDGLQCSWLTSLFISSDGRFWVGTDCGVSEFLLEKNRFNQRIKNYLGGESLTDPRVWCMAEDISGNLWIGSADGAIQILRGGLTTYTEVDGLGSRTVVSINESRTGELFVHTRSSRQDVLNRFDGQRFTAIKPNLPKAIALTEWHIGLQDREKKWWLITPQEIWTFPETNDLESLARLRPKLFYRSPIDGLLTAFEDRNGDIWFSSRVEKRLMRWERATATLIPYTENQGLPALGDFAWLYGEDREGNLWILFENLGLARYANGGFRVLPAEDGIPSKSFGRFFFDRQGRLWIASGAEGLIRIDNPTAQDLQVSRYTIANGLSSHEVLCITEDQWGRLYIGTTRGLDRLDPATGRFKHFTTADGLANIQVNHSLQDRNGTLWFGTDTGLSRLIPEADRAKSPPAIFINRIHIPNRDYRVSEMGETLVRGLELDANQNHIQIDFVSLEFGAGEVLQYQYQLAGADADWQPLTTQRSVNYANLAPGAYHFSVRAVNSEGVFSPNPASLEFIILAPLWQRWWFITLVALCTILMVNAIYRYRLTQRLEVERMRVRIAADLHDDIGSSLTQIAILSEVLRVKAGHHDQNFTNPLSQIARVSREAVDSMSDIVWAINPQRDHLFDLSRRMRRFASELLPASNIEFNFKAPGENADIELGADVRRQVFLIFKESVNNIARHSDCQLADIELSIAGEWLVLKVRDNGKGLDIDQVSQGNGLSSMRRRAQSLGGKIDITSDNGNGTTLTLTIPHRIQRIPIETERSFQSSNE
jgi:ligand-binding sensor domain-containing protein/two-component sensor histidine kinase